MAKMAAAFGGDLCQDVNGGTAGDLAVDALVFGGDGAFDHAEEFPRIFLHGVMEALFCLASGRCHHRFMVIKGDDLENQAADIGMRDPQQTFGTAGAFLKVQPDYRRPLCGGGRFYQFGNHGLRDAKRRRHHGATLQKSTPVDL